MTRRPLFFTALLIALATACERMGDDGARGGSAGAPSSSTAILTTNRDGALAEGGAARPGGGGEGVAGAAGGGGEAGAGASGGDAGAGADLATPWVHENPESKKVCGDDMLLIDGIYCPYAGHRCIDWIDEKRDRCAKYAAPPLCEGKKQKKHFCIDRYEYPNLEGVHPAVMVDWLEAKAICETEGKRLCTSSEWTLACEGEEILPYPYGYTRDPAMCNIDRPRPVPEPDFESFSHPRKISAEVARLDLRLASGEKAGCVSPYGVRDTTGNVDEWVVNEAHFDPPPPGEKPPYISGLKGGYWGPIRSRCRPITPSHNEWFRFYQVGFRCCADPPDGEKKKPAPH